MSDYRRFAIAVFSALGLAALINLAYVLIGYIELGTYLDHAEPDTAIMAWRFASGEPLYYRPTDVEHIFTAYGPLLYIITGLPFQFLAPSIVDREALKILKHFRNGWRRQRRTEFLKPIFG